MSLEDITFQNKTAARDQFKDSKMLKATTRWRKFEIFKNAQKFFVEYFKSVFGTCKQAIKSIRQGKDEVQTLNKKYERVVDFLKCGK